MRTKIAAPLAVPIALTATSVNALVIDDAKASIRLHLILPGSAKIDNLRPRGDFICGTVSVKTSAGDFVGPKVMIYNTKP
jgi:hypothetical protein